MIKIVCTALMLWTITCAVWDFWRWHREMRSPLSGAVIPEMPVWRRLWHALWPWGFWHEWEAQHAIWCLQNDGSHSRWTLTRGLSAKDHWL